MKKNTAKESSGSSYQSYDFYDYPRYWQKRQYEDQAEKIALKKFLALIPQKASLIDIGGGFGRLAETYLAYCRDCLLVDPSQKLLAQAKAKLQNYPSLRFKQGKAQNLPAADNCFDVALMVRVAHHLPQIQTAFREAFRVLKPGGFLILEFANKIHLKSVFKALLKRNFNYLLSHLPANLSSQKKVLFFNYHPSHIQSLLQTQGFKVIKTLSVSNFRNPLFKKIVPLKILLWLESYFQNFAAPFYFGPSIFVLAQKPPSNYHVSIHDNWQGGRREEKKRKKT